MLLEEFGQHRRCFAGLLVPMRVRAQCDLRLELLRGLSSILELHDVGSSQVGVPGMVRLVAIPQAIGAHAGAGAGHLDQEAREVAVGVFDLALVRGT